MLELLEPILSVETVTILQLIGFNFKQAIGGPLTTLVAALIQSRMPPSTETGAEAQRASLELQRATVELALNEEAYERFRRLWSSQ